jgi:hypothetical protein
MTQPASRPDFPFHISVTPKAQKHFSGGVTAEQMEALRETMPEEFLLRARHADPAEQKAAVEKWEAWRDQIL